MTTTLNHPGGTPEFTLDNSKVPNGTILLFGIEYPGMGQTDLDTTRGRETPKVFTYAMLKAGGLWYVTGTGRVPQAAGWGAVMNWLRRDGREVRWVKAATEMVELWPSPVDTSQASE